MTHSSQHQHSPQAVTSITKAGQPMGCARMRQCVANWLQKNTGQDCHC